MYNSRNKKVCLTLNVIVYCLCILASSSTVYAYSFPEVAIEAKYGTFSAGSVQNTGQVVVTARNSGHETLENGILKLGALPNGISAISGQTTSRNISRLSIDKESTESYTFQFSKEVKSGVYPISFTFAGKYGEDLESDYQAEQTFYLQVSNADLDAVNEESYLYISDIKAPTEAFENKEFPISFLVTNQGPSRVEQVKISVDGNGMVNKSTNVLVEPTLEVGQTKNYSMILYGGDTLQSGNYPIKISVEPSGSTTKNSAGFPAISQYVGVFLNISDKDVPDDSVKQPQLMVAQYSYGDSAVKSGGQFTLSLTLKNTSQQKSLRNIKVAMTSDDGSLIPIDSSNSLYIEYLPVRGQSQQQMTFAVNPDTPSQLAVLSVESVYEDMNANVLQSKEIISIPIRQKSQLEIGDIMVPNNIQVGQPAVLNVDFCNSGQTTLNNLKVVASGAFSLDGSPTTYVGNVESGQNGRYQLTFTPNNSGTLEGVLSFRYNDDQGESCAIEKSFTMEVGEVNISTASTESDFPWIGWGLGGLALLVCLCILWRRRNTRLPILPDDPVDNEE